MHPPTPPSTTFFSRLTSVATAVSVLLGSKNLMAGANGLNCVGQLSGDSSQPEPLVLAPAVSVSLSDHLFAAHRSHSSHSSHASHRSHYSGTSGGYYSPSVPSIPIGAGQVAKSDPANPSTTNTLISRIELTNGAIVFGTLVVKSSAGIGLRTLDGKYYKIPRVILAQSTVQTLGLPSQ